MLRSNRRAPLQEHTMWISAPLICRLAAAVGTTRVSGIVLLALYIWFDELWWHQLHLVKLPFTGDQVICLGCDQAAKRTYNNRMAPLQGSSRGCAPLDKR
jgi:hypothetical protein